jgi:hypothetical protein
VPGLARPRLAAPLAIATLAVLAAGCGSARPAVKANGCTATVSGHSAGRPAVTYSTATQDPKVLPALAQAVSRWNASGAHVLLQSAPSGGTISFVETTTAPTHTARCARKGPRTVTVYLNSNKFASGGTKTDPLPDLVAREIGHALGLAPAGPCGALMTTACKKVPPGPDAAEVAEINRLYARA